MPATAPQISSHNRIAGNQAESQGFPASIAQQSIEFIEDYARERPISLALWALGIGFVLGWKLKPW
jgi:hypothetical protein